MKIFPTKKIKCHCCDWWTLHRIHTQHVWRVFDAQFQIMALQKSENQKFLKILLWGMKLFIAVFNCKVTTVVSLEICYHQLTLIMLPRMRSIFSIANRSFRFWKSACVTIKLRNSYAILLYFNTNTEYYLIVYLKAVKK